MEWIHCERVYWKKWTDWMEWTEWNPRFWNPGRCEHSAWKIHVNGIPIAWIPAKAFTMNPRGMSGWNGRIGQNGRKFSS
jgi:hypothetical protein